MCRILLLLSFHNFCTTNTSEYILYIPPHYQTILFAYLLFHSHERSNNNSAAIFAIWSACISIVVVFPSDLLPVLLLSSSESSDNPFIQLASSLSLPEFLPPVLFDLLFDSSSIISIPASHSAYRGVHTIVLYERGTGDAFNMSINNAIPTNIRALILYSNVTVQI